MADTVDPETRSRMMAGIKGKNTHPEMLLRSALHRRGFRFKLHDKSLPGKPDLVLPRYRAVINVHGCFWHGHQDCRYFRVPSTRTDFWIEKIEGNRIRDGLNCKMLVESGWRVMTVWECAIRHGSADKLEHSVELIANWLASGSKTSLIEGLTVS